MNKNTYSIILTFLITCAIIQGFVLILPSSIFKDFDVISSSVSLFFLLIVGGIGLSIHHETRDILFLILHLSLLLIPLIGFVYTYSRYHKILNRDKEHLTRFRQIQGVYTLFLLLQLSIYYYAIQEPLGLNNYLMFAILLGKFNIFMSGLAWRELAFFVTDG